MAVCSFGKEKVSSGSKIENLGYIRGLPNGSFAFFDALETTASRLTSEPDAGKVTIVARGIAELQEAPKFSTIRQGSPSYLAPKAINFVASITEPPPTANK